MAGLIWMSGQLSKSGEQEVHSLFGRIFFPFFALNHWFSILAAHENTETVKNRRNSLTPPKSIIFKSQKVESGISVHFKSSLGDSNLQPGLGKSAWDLDSLLPCVKMAFLSLIFLRNDYETIYKLVRLLVSHEQCLYEIMK